MRVRAIWNGVVLAESEETVMVEGNHYFPTDSINNTYFIESDRRTVCPWKGLASYYDVVVDDQVNRGAAWYYPEPSRAADNIRGYVAFWNGVKVERVKDESEVLSESAFSRVFNALRIYP
jgi:uncharacterized protein (DUF427 family)